MLKRERTILNAIQLRQSPQPDEKVYTKASGLVQDSEVKNALRLDGHPAWKNVRTLSRVCDNLDLYMRDSRLDFTMDTTETTSETAELQEVRAYGPHTYEYMVTKRRELMTVNPSALYPVWKMVDQDGNVLPLSTVIQRYVNSIQNRLDTILRLLEGNK